MRVIVVEQGTPDAWRGGIDAMVASLAGNVGWIVDRADLASWVRGAPGDAYLLSCGIDADYDLVISRCRARRQLPRTVLLGVDLPWELGTAEARVGTLPALLELHDLAGAFRSAALLVTGRAN